MRDEPVTGVAVPSNPILRRLRSGLSPHAPADWDAFTSLTVVIVGILALAFALLTPPFQFPDEHGHFVRAYQVSNGQFIGRPNPRLPAAVLTYLLRYPEGRAQDAERFKPEIFVPEMFAGSARESTGPQQLIESDPGHKHFAWGAIATQLYCPIVYLPASAGISIARVLNMPPPAMLYAGRVLSVLSFLAAFVVCLLLAPDFRALTTAVVLMPMTLHQAAAISADQMTISISLVGFALILRAREQPVSCRFLAILFVLFPCWALCKGSLWALPLVLLIPSARFGGNWKRAGYVMGAALSLIVAVALWRAVNRDANLAFFAAGLARGIDMQGNTQIIVCNPFGFMRHIVTWLHYGFSELIRHFVGAFGWRQFGPPAWTSFVLLTLPLAAGCTEWTRKPFTATDRIVLSLVFAGAAIQTYCLLFIVDGTYDRGQYDFASAGVQGRYFIPFCLAGFLALKQSAVTLKSRVLTPIVLSAETIYAVVSIGVLWQSYYR